MEDDKMTEVEESFDSKADAFFNEVEKETPTGSSPETKPEETETESAKDTTAESKNTDKSEAKEVEVPKEFHKHPAWQRILKERDEARKAAEELKTSIPKEDLEAFQKVTSSPEYIKARMTAEGYTPEAINRKLGEMGHQVEVPQTSDVDLVLRELKIDTKSLTEEGRNYINTYVADAAKVADIIVRDRLGKFLPNELKPLQDTLGEITRQTTGNKLGAEMRSTVEAEGVLDFAKDIEPKLIEYIESNQQATQQDVYQHFKELNHKLTIERLKYKGKKDERAEKKGQLRQNIEGTNLSGLKLDKTGDFDSDADRFFDALGIK